MLLIFTSLSNVCSELKESDTLVPSTSTLSKNFPYSEKTKSWLEDIYNIIVCIQSLLPLKVSERKKFCHNWINSNAQIFLGIFQKELQRSKMNTISRWIIGTKVHLNELQNKYNIKILHLDIENLEWKEKDSKYEKIAVDLLKTMLYENVILKKLITHITNIFHYQGKPPH